VQVTRCARVPGRPLVVCQQQCVSACAGWSLPVSLPRSRVVTCVCLCDTWKEGVVLPCVCVSAVWLVLLYAAALLLLRVVSDSVCVCVVCTHPQGVQVLNKVPIHTKGLVVGVVVAVVCMRPILPRSKRLWWCMAGHCMLA
jgi:hypothetical protein